MSISQERDHSRDAHGHKNTGVASIFNSESDQFPGVGTGCEFVERPEPPHSATTQSVRLRADSLFSLRIEAVQAEVACEVSIGIQTETRIRSRRVVIRVSARWFRGSPSQPSLSASGPFRAPIELGNFSLQPVSISEFEVPAGYKQVQSPMEKFLDKSAK